MSKISEKYDLPEFEELLDKGLTNWQNNPGILNDLTGLLNAYLDRVKELPRSPEMMAGERKPERGNAQQLLLLSTLYYLTGLFRNSQSELEEANISYEEVLGLLTHEFKNLLSTLDGYQRIIEHDLLQLDRPDMLETHRAGNRIVKKLFNILESILKFYQSDRKLLTPDYKLTEFEEDILIPMEREYEADLKSRGMQIKRKAKGARKMINVDPQLVEIAIRNLLENAIKYSQPGSKIEISHTFTDLELMIRIKSYNNAIPADLCDGIFEKFRTKKIGNAKTGTGIGLFNVRNIVHLHNGSIKCHSKSGKWISFEIILPIENT